MRAGRRALDDVVRREILAREQSASLEHVVARGGGHVAGVQMRRALGAESIEKVGELGEPDRLALLQQAPLGRVDRPPLRAGGEDRPEDAHEMRLYPRELVARAGDRR